MKPALLRAFGFLCTTIAIASLSGCCATRHCKDMDGPNVIDYQVSESHPRDVLQGHRNTETIDMLVLSGGGSHGAWGAGVLRGWRDNQQNPRPKQFRVVTGVSTGALLATYAFLGEPEDDALLGQVYTNVVTKDIYRKKFLPFAIFSDSISSSAPLEHLIAAHITSNTLTRVAAGHKEGRGLYVGTVNLDSGKLVIWDLGKIASSNNLQLYREVVLASASIPLMVSPVKIDGNLYVDGGVREQMFFDSKFFPSFKHSDLEAGESPREHPKLNLHVIVNSKLGVNTNCVGDCLLEIVPRTLDVLLDANAFGDLYHLKYLLSLNHFGHFGLAAIPPDFEVTSSAVFDPVMMGKLYEKGAEFGRDRKNWPNRIP
jgi:hypothetical protein